MTIVCCFRGLWPFQRDTALGDNYSGLDLLTVPRELLDELLDIKGINTSGNSRCNRRVLRSSMDDDQPPRFFSKSTLQ